MVGVERWQMNANDKNKNSMEKELREQIEELYINALNDDTAPNVFAEQILFLFGVVRTLCDCKEHSIKTNYGFEVCTKCGNEFND